MVYNCEDVGYEECKNVEQCLNHTLYTISTCFQWFFLSLDASYSSIMDGLLSICGGTSTLTMPLWLLWWLFVSLFWPNEMCVVLFWECKFQIIMSIHVLIVTMPKTMMMAIHTKPSKCIIVITTGTFDIWILITSNRFRCNPTHVASSEETSMNRRNNGRHSTEQYRNSVNNRLIIFTQIVFRYCTFDGQHKVSREATKVLGEGRAG